MKKKNDSISTKVTTRETISKSIGTSEGNDKAYKAPPPSSKILGIPPRYMGKASKTQKQEEEKKDENTG